MQPLLRALILTFALSVLVCGQQTPNVVQPGAPGAPSTTLPPSTRATAATPSKADIEFMQGMIMHHAQAVEMTALIPSHTKDPGVRALGRRISLSQSDEIRWMEHWLRQYNQPTEMDMSSMGDHTMMMPGMLTPEQMDALRHSSGPKFDHLFLTGMIQHHGGALTMVRDLFASPGTGQEPDLFTFATDVDNTQRAEIKLMQRMLKETR